MAYDKEEIKKSMENMWSDYCSLDNWIRDMDQRDIMPNKQVLKMAMKHLRGTIHTAHKIMYNLSNGEMED